MSLFCSYDWWSTHCEGKLDVKTINHQNAEVLLLPISISVIQEEELDFHAGSLYVADLIKCGVQIILVGNHSGTLWAFKPTSSNSPKDLLFEYNFGKPIIALGSGSLLSGSQEKQLVVLHPTKANIYSFHESFGNAAHGQQFHLEPVYTITFQFLAYSIVTGSFGSGVGRLPEKPEKDRNAWSKSAQDSICVQAMDGSLHFYENDLNFLCISSKNVHKGSLTLKHDKLSRNVESTRGISRNTSFNNSNISEDAADVTRAEVHECPPDNISSRGKNLKGASNFMNSRGIVSKGIPEEAEKDLQQLDSDDRMGDNHESSIQISKPKFSMASFQDTYLPTFLCYMPPEDCFIIFSGSWAINCYRYTTLELQQIGSRKKKSIMPEWSFTLGEPIFSLSYLEGYIFALGTRGTLVSLNQYGVARFCKKLCFCPSAFHPFVADGKLMLLVTSEEGTLMVFDGGAAITSSNDSQLYPLPSATPTHCGRLVWSAKLPFTPIAIARGSFEELSGLVIILSEQGHLQCCHLGTTPKNFMEMPVTRMTLNEDIKEIEEKLGQQTIAETGLNPLATPKEGMELSLELIINSVKLFPSNEYTSRMSHSEESTDTKKMSSLLVSTEVEMTLIMVPLIPLNNICLSATVDSPYVASFGNNFIERLSEEAKIPLQVNGNYDQSFQQDAVPNLNVEVVASCFGGYSGTADRMSLLVFHTSKMLPLSAVFSQNNFYDTEEIEVLEVSKQKKKFEFLFHGYNSPSLSTIFPEFHIPSTDSKSSRLDVFFYGNHLKSIRVTRECEEENSETGSLDCIYSITSSCNLPLYSLTHIFAQRIENYISEMGSQVAASGGRQKGRFFQLTLKTPLPIAELLEAVDDHFLARQTVIQLKHDLGVYTNQLHMAECSILSKVRDVTPKPIIFTETLLEQFFEKVFDGIEDLEAAQNELVFKTKKLRILIDLVVHLQPEISGNPKFKIFERAISITMEDFLQQGWEERTNAGLAYLLKQPGKSNQQQLSTDASNPMDQNVLCSHSLKNEIRELLNKFTNAGKSESAVTKL